MQALSTNYLQTLISLSTTKVARLIPVLSFRTLKINYFNLLWHVLIQLLILLIEEFQLILLRIREIPGTLFSNFYLRLSSPDWVHAVCGVFYVENHPFDQETDQGHILFHCEQKLLAAHLLEDKISKISAGKTKPFLQVLYQRCQESKLIFYFDGIWDPVVMGSW